MHSDMHFQEFYSKFQQRKYFKKKTISDQLACVVGVERGRG